MFLGGLTLATVLLILVGGLRGDIWASVFVFFSLMALAAGIRDVNAAAASTREDKE